MGGVPRDGPGPGSSTSHSLTQNSVLYCPATALTLTFGGDAHWNSFKIYPAVFLSW